MEATLRDELSRLPEFEGWDASESLHRALTDLETYAEEWSYSEGDFIRFPDEAESGPTWVIAGSLVVLEQDHPCYVGVRERVPASRAWVRGQTAGRFLVVPQTAWNGWLNRHSSARISLGLPIPPQLPRSLQRSRNGISTQETVLKIQRQAPHQLLARLAVPLFFLLLFSAVGLALPFLTPKRITLAVVEALPLLGAALSLGFLLVRLLEWRLCALVLTDQSLLVRQLDLSSRQSRFEKMALNRLREAKLSQRGWVDRILGTSTIEVESDSANGGISFSGVRNGKEFMEALDSARKDHRPPGPPKALIRRALAERAEGARVPKLSQAARREVLDPGAQRKKENSELREIIRFRRHPWHWIHKISPWLGMLVLLVGAGFVAAIEWPSAAKTAWFLALWAGLFPLAKISWSGLDWFNDCLEVTREKVSLVQRKPLWLGEVRQDTLLSDVEQIGIQKPSFSALLFNFGNLVVRCGGAEPLVFTMARHPESIQDEIFERRAALHQQEQEREAQRRLDEVATILDTWDEARQVGYFKERKDAP